MKRSLWTVIDESARVAAATRAVSALVLIFAATVPAAALGLSGLNIEAQTAILSRVDDVGARVITILSTGREAAIPSSAVDRIARLDGVAWVIGLGPVIDVQARRVGGRATPARRYEAVRAPIAFSRHTADGGAFLSIASAKRVGLAGAYSVLDPDGTSVVGWFRSDPPVASLESFILITNDDDESRLERVIVAVNDVGWVESVAARFGAMVGRSASAEISVERSPALLQARAVVRDELAQRDRELVVALLGAAMGIAGLVVFAGSVAARRDFGRRRALGATQTQLMLLVMLGTLWPTVIGATAGTILGWLYLGSRLGYLSNWQFPASLLVLTVLSLVVASVLPAAVAATRDPLRVLRVP